MTYCLAIRIQDGLVCLADGRVTSGNQVSAAPKASLHGDPGRRFLIMTSGLRSLRDKTLAYLDREIRREDFGGFPQLLDAVDVYARCLRRTAEEDRSALETSNLRFNLHAIIAGQMPEDPRPTAFLVYPEGNWIEVNARTPYLSIGAVAYGKPILDRTLRDDTPMPIALKAAYLSFDSTRVSSADVGFPMDLMTLGSGDPTWRALHFQHDDLREQREWWNRHLTELTAQLPDAPWREALDPAAAGGRIGIVGSGPAEGR
jgi:putative proteasome-type protease